MLEAAEAWGVAPWEIAEGQGSRFAWYVRWREYTTEKNKAFEERARKQQAGKKP